MDNGNNKPKEPQDSVRKSNNNIKKLQNNANEKVPQDTIPNQKQPKDKQEDCKIEMEEIDQKMSHESMVQEVIQEKSNDLNNFNNELENILASLNVVWEKNRDGFENYYQSDIIPKINEFLNYPCITAIQEKIFLIFRFFCRYFLLRKNYLKEIPVCELVQMVIIQYNPINIFSVNPNGLNNQQYELIDDRLFYQIFKEMLPNKEVENTYGILTKNCMYKYFIEFLFQCGYVDSYINDILVRNDFSPNTFAQVSFIPFYLLNFCDKQFILSKNYNIKMIKTYNSKIDYFLSDKNPWIKNYDEMMKFGQQTSNFFLDMLFGIFNNVLDELQFKNNIDCEIFCINIFKFCEYYLKDQKINIRICVIQLAGFICGLYNYFYNKYNEYKKKYNDIDKTYSFAVHCAILYLNKINIFDLIFGENIHEGLIQRAYPILSFLYRNKSFNSMQIQTLWDLSKTKYQSISNSIITLFGALLPEFSNDDCNRILNIVSKMDFKEVNETTLKLLENFFVSNHKSELLLNILFKFSNELSYEKGLEKNIIFKSREILVKLLFNNNYTEDLIKYMKNCLFYIKNFYLVNTYSSTLSQILDEFDKIKNEHQKLKDIYNRIDKRIQDFGLMITYFDEKYTIFPIFLNCLLKIIKIYKFCYVVTLNIMEQISQGNFEYEQFLNIDSLYYNYQEFVKQNLNISFDNNNNHDENKMDVDFEGNNNQILNTDKKEEIIIKDSEHVNYIKNILKDFAKFFRETFVVSNTLPSKEEIKRDIFGKLKLFFENYNYIENIKHILKIMYINHIRANNHFKLNYLNFLFTIGQNTLDIDPSIEWYYNLLYDLFSSQINSNNNLNLLNDENLEFLLKQYITKSDFQFLPISAFNTANLFYIYANSKKNSAIFSPLIKKYTEIKNFHDFHGFDVIWNFFLTTNNAAIYNEALNILINILELASQNIEGRIYYNNIIFNFMETNKNNIQNNQKIKNAFIRNLKLISVINGAKITKNILDNKNDSIDLLIQNNYFTTQVNAETVKQIKVPKNIKVKNFKELIINNILCTENNLKLYNNLVNSNNNYASNMQNNAIMNTDNNNNIISTSSDPNDIILEKNITSLDELKKEIYRTNILVQFRTKILQDEYTLADYNIENNNNLTILKGSGYVEEEYKPTEDEFKSGFEAIKLIFGENLYFSEEVMKASIIKHRGNSEDAALYLTVPENVQILEKEIEEKKKRVQQNDDEIMCLEQNKIELLLDVLNNNNDPEINRNIWQLFSEIKYPDDLIKKIIGEEFEKILSANNVNYMILFLKILNSLVFDDNFCKYNKLKKEEKNNWISIFIKKENIITNLFTTLSNINEKIIDQNKIFQILSIFINWFHKIILKIDNLLKNENRNTRIGIKILHEMNSENNININNTSINNQKENQQNNSEEFEIINKDEAINFIIILYKINGIQSFYKILNILLNINYKGEEKIIIIEDIYEIFITYLILQPTSIPQLSLMEKNNNILTNIIYNGKDIIISKITKNFIKALFSNIFSFIDKKELDKEDSIFNVIFITFINRIMNGNEFNEIFSELFGTLLVFQTNELVLKLIDPLIYKLLNHVYDLCSKFDRYDYLAKKKIICETYIIYCFVKFYKENLKKYINKMLTEEKKDFIDIIFNCLFETSKNKNKINTYKFNDIHLRQHSFDLLTELISSDENYLYQLLPKVLSHHKKLKEFDANKIQIPLDVNLRSPLEKFVGLRNFGCTCYLNSLFQQMFMIPTFRYDLLNNFIIKSNNDDEYKYSVLYNMQITFQNLLTGIMSPYPPIRFIKSFLSAFNGQPIQLGVMQDSDEFLAILCDNLEKEAKPFGQENFLENSFKGKISNEILSQEKEYPYYSQSEEPFYRITLDIKEHKTLEEALDAYIKGEILDGDNKYYVEKYKRKISIRKSCSLKKLGNEVIIHLKRFEFDFITFTNKKLNDYLKFPKTINFKKWTRAFLRLNDNNISKDLLNITKEEEQNLIDENMDYILTGILIHGGSNLQSGHYYSYIVDQKIGKWHQYNDNVIRDYNIETDLEKECFGILPEKKDDYGKTAYLLFYTNKKCFNNKELLQKIDVNENILNDVYNENVNFLNLNLYTNFYYFKFLKEFATFGSCLLEDEIYDGDHKTLTMNKNLIKDEHIYYKVLSVIKGDEDDNDDSVDENCNDENNITNKENFEQIYNKCKEEIESILKQEKLEKINKNKKNNYNKKSIVKLYFNYLFGIVFPYMSGNTNFLIQGLETLNSILKNNTGYSLWILKQIEKNVDLFTDFLFRFGTTENEMNDLNKLIIDFFQITFDAIYSYEKEITGIIFEEIKYFSKNDKGKYIIVKEYKSIIMRLMKKLFCENLEKSRIEYTKSSLYLIIFYNFVKGYPETSSICVKYLMPTIVSLITNNILSNIKSEINPKYLMGNNTSYTVNNNYMLIFSDIILRCVTPGMENTKTFSPYFTGRRNLSEEHNSSYIDFSKYPHLPDNWEKMLSIEFFINFVLFHSFSKSKEIICHLCYGDESTSNKILSLLNQFIKQKNVFIPFIEKVFNNAINVFELKDALEFTRLDTLFQLNDENNIDNKEPCDIEDSNLFDYYYEEREKHINLVLCMLYNFAKAIEKYSIISQYFEKNKSKIIWINYFLMELKTDPKMKEDFSKNNAMIMNQHPDLLQVIQKSIIKRFELDSN